VIEVHVYVDDLDAALTRALAAGGTLERTHDYPGLWRLAGLADPAGNGVDLIQMDEGAYDKLAAL
jgi:predicted enzyme related to lactoylglutathione lyase